MSLVCTQSKIQGGEETEATVLEPDLSATGSEDSVPQSSMPDMPDEVQDTLDRESVADEEADVIEPNVDVPYQNVRRSGRTIRLTSDSRPDEVFYGRERGKKNSYFTAAKSYIRKSKLLSKAVSGRLSGRMHAYHITVKEALKKMPKAAI